MRIVNVFISVREEGIKAFFFGVQIKLMEEKLHYVVWLCKSEYTRSGKVSLCV